MNKLVICSVFFLVKKGQMNNKPYLESESSKLVENTKAIELTIIKELGKLTTRNFGIRGAH